jgi:tRNA-binding EMAP/Myf-like protein
VDLGDEKRQIVAGLKQYYKAEEMIGKHIVVVSNLKKAKLGGEVSEGMLLAAEKGDEVIVLEAADSVPGDTLAPEGMEPEEREILYKDFQKVAMTIRGRVAVLGESPLVTADGKHAHAHIDDGAGIH